MITKNMRINYKRGAYIVSTDKRTFTLWEDGIITSEQGAVMLAESNNTEVTPAQFEANAVDLGYRRRKKDYATD